MKRCFLGLVFGFTLICCNTHKQQTNNNEEETVSEVIDDNIPFRWESANLYFLLVDRFFNGDPSNDINFSRTQETGVLRGFEGGDIKGITQKIKEGYFTQLGVNAIWLSPIVEQIHGATDEGTGNTYGFHGYWTKDWTTIDPNFGTEDDLRELVATAHEHGIRIVLDAVINHTGPVTDKDIQWDSEWVRTEPKCSFQNYEGTVKCTLVDNLPDIKTESRNNVELPSELVKKWKAEGRYEKELEELNQFFDRTGYPRAPQYYIIKWLTDYIVEYGIDGYRVDTVKHVDEWVWYEFQRECKHAFNVWKQQNDGSVLDDNDFYLVGEVYSYGISSGKQFDFGDRKVNYFENGFDGLINFELKSDAAELDYESLFTKYHKSLYGDLKGKQILNYLSSHDDGSPYDRERKNPYRAANILLLTPGTSQIYYGDESARKLLVPGANGDANLRSFMNWDEIKSESKTQKIMEHWGALGRFRKHHPAVGAGVHQMLSEEPYVFERILESGNVNDVVVVGLDLDKELKSIPVGTSFKEGDMLIDSYSGKEAKVQNGMVEFVSDFQTVLLSKK